MLAFAWWRGAAGFLAGLGRLQAVFRSVGLPLGPLRIGHIAVTHLAALLALQFQQAQPRRIAFAVEVLHIGKLVIEDRHGFVQLGDLRAGPLRIGQRRSPRRLIAARRRIHLGDLRRDQAGLRVGNARIEALRRMKMQPLARQRIGNRLIPRDIQLVIGQRLLRLGQIRARQ